MGENIQVSLGGILRTSWRFYKANFKSIFTIVLILSLIGGLLSALLSFFAPADLAYDAQIEEINQKVETGEIGQIEGLMEVGGIESSPQAELYEKSTSFLNSIFLIIAYLVIIILVVNRINNQQISVKESFRAVWKRILPVIGTYLLMIIIMVGIFLGVGIIGLLVGGIFSGVVRSILPFFIGFFVLLAFVPLVGLQMYWAFIPQATLIREKTGMDALKYSWNLVKNRWWKTFGYSLVIGLVILLFMVLLSVVLIPLAFMSGIFALTIINLLTSLTGSFSAVAITVMFLAYEQNRISPTVKENIT